MKAVHMRGPHAQNRGQHNGSQRRGGTNGARDPETFGTEAIPLLRRSRRRRCVAAAARLGAQQAEHDPLFVDLHVGPVDRTPAACVAAA